MNKEVNTPATRKEEPLEKPMIERSGEYAYFEPKPIDETPTQDLSRENDGEDIGKCECAMKYEGGKITVKGEPNE